jgi:hypothetical protein
MKIAKCDDFDQVEQRGGFLSARPAELAIQLPSNGRELFAQSLLLVVASGFKIHTVGWAGDSGQAMFPAALTADQTVEGRTGSFSLALVAVQTLTHFVDGPFFSDFSGWMNP